MRRTCRLFDLRGTPARCVTILVTKKSGIREQDDRLHQRLSTRFSFITGQKKWRRPAMLSTGKEVVRCHEDMCI